MPTKLVLLVLTAAVLFQSPSFPSAVAHSVLNPGRQTATRARIPAPEDVLGFVPGDDRKLASWNQVIEYFRALAKASDRVKFDTLGKSTMGQPFVMATISAPENLARLDEYKQIQKQLADPRELGGPSVRDHTAEELIKRGKTIVLITCGIHSTEVGSYLSSMLIAHRLASSDSPDIKQVLRNTIILLVPSLNPDGVDIVKNWYDKTLGTRYEGTSPPELYQKYAGHDNNRDWYAFTQVETRITVEQIYNIWHPQIVHDIHQQSAFGSRFFLPPYMAPVEPNVPQQIVAGYTELGNFMAREMRAAGFKGITTNSTYDAWSPARSYAHHHGGVRILSETASCKIATPITIKSGDLRAGEGYDPAKESANFGPLWGGGEWRLRDITNYMTTGAFLLLRHASKNREEWLRRFYEIGKEAVAPRKKGELFAFIIEAGGNDYFGLLATLRRGGVELVVADAGKAGNFEYPHMSAIVPLAQPYGGFAKALLETQQYPHLIDQKRNPISPYDVTAHTLSLLFGATVRPVYEPFEYTEASYSKTSLPSLCIKRDSRYGVYQSHVPSMDEGWTRWAFVKAGGSLFSFMFDREGKHKCITYTSLHDNDIRFGKLSAKYKSIVIPDQAPRLIMNGHAKGAMPDEYTGGLGEQGVKGLRKFVEQGGTLVCLNRAASFAIEQFKLPVRDVVAELSKKEFFVPGSILRIELDTTSPIARGMPSETIAWVEDSPVFEVVSPGASPGTASPGSAPPGTAGILPAVRVIARYPAGKNPLLSGWLLGENRIRGKAALVEVKLGKGRIILFGFRPQYRGQSLATYPLFFNAISDKK